MFFSLILTGSAISTLGSKSVETSSYSKPTFSKILCNLRFSHFKLEVLNNFESTAKLTGVELF